ncbi:hypothetical protein FKR81_42830, partial [Lentzea tibetensis]
MEVVMMPWNPAGDEKNERERDNEEESPFVGQIGNLSLSERAPKSEKVPAALTLDVTGSWLTNEQYDALTAFARDVAHTAVAYHVYGEAIPPVTVSGPLYAAGEVQRALSMVITSYLPDIQHDKPGDRRLAADKIIITTATPSDTTTTVSLPHNTVITPAPRLVAPSLPKYNTNITSPPASPSSPPSSPSNDPSLTSSNDPSLTQPSSSQSTTPTHPSNPPLPQRYSDEALGKFGGTGGKAEWFAPLWGLLLKHPEPMSISEISNSGKRLPLKFPTGKVKNYIPAMRQAGLVVENGQAGKTYLYSPVIPPGISKIEQTALLGWARGLPGPADRKAATTNLTSGPNILPLPATLHARVVQNTANNSENTLLVSKTFEVLLTAEKPLSALEIADRLKQDHHFPNATKKTLTPYLNAMITSNMASCPTAGKTTTTTAQYSAKIPLPAKLLSDRAFQEFLDKLSDVNDRVRAEQRSKGIDPIAQQVSITAPPSFPTSDTLKDAFRQSETSRSAHLKENDILQVWATLLVNNPATNKELAAALSGTVATRETESCTQLLQLCNMAVVYRRLGKVNVYKGVVPQGLEIDGNLRNWVDSLPGSMKVKAQSCLDNPFATSAPNEPSLPPLPPRVAAHGKNEGLSTHRTCQVLGMLLRTSTPLSNETIQARLKSEYNLDTSKDNINRYLSFLAKENLATSYSKDSRTSFYVGKISESVRNTPGLAKWASELSDDVEQANAQTRIGGIEPLGAARPLPPLPAALRDIFGDGPAKRRAAATLGAMLSTDKPLIHQDIADVVQRDYRLAYSAVQTRLDLVKLRSSGVVKEIDETGNGTYFTAVIPADMVKVTALERKALTDWARGVLTGRPQTDALARIGGVEPLDSNPERRDQFEPIKRSQFSAATNAARPLPPMQSGKQLFHRRHIIPSHQMRDSFKSWVNYHYPPGHGDRAEMVRVLQAWEKQMFNYVPNLWIGRGNTNSGAGFLRKALLDAADLVDLADYHIVGEDAVKVVSYNTRAHEATQKALAKPALKFLDLPEDNSAGTSGARDPNKADWVTQEWVPSEYLNELSSSADFDWPGGTREQYERYMRVYLWLRDVAFAPGTYSLADLTSIRDEFLDLPEPSAVTAGNGLIDYEAIEYLNIAPEDGNPMEGDIGGRRIEFYDSDGNLLRNRTRSLDEVQESVGGAVEQSGRKRERSLSPGESVKKKSLSGSDGSFLAPPFMARSGSGLSSVLEWSESELGGAGWIDPDSGERP